MFDSNQARGYLIRILVCDNLLSNRVLDNHVLRQAALKGPKLKSVKCFLVLLSEVFKRFDSTNYDASLILLIEELFIQSIDRLNFRVRFGEPLMSAVQLEEFLKLGLAEHFVNLLIINFIKLLVKFHELLVLLRNPLDFSVKSSTGIDHSLFKIKDERLQLSVGSFDICEFCFNLFSEGSPFLMLFFDFVYYKDDMVLVFFGAALHAVVRMSVVFSATLLEAYEHDFKTVAANAFLHVV